MKYMPPSIQAISADFTARMTPAIKAMKIEEIKPLLQSAAKRVRLTYGLYKFKVESELHRW